MQACHTLSRAQSSVPPSSVVFTWSLFARRSRLAPTGGAPQAPGFTASRWLSSGISFIVLNWATPLSSSSGTSRLRRGAPVNLVSVAYFLGAQMILVPGSCLAFRCERLIMSGPCES